MHAPRVGRRRPRRSAPRRSDGSRAAAHHAPPESEVRGDPAEESGVAVHVLLELRPAVNLHEDDRSEVKLSHSEVK